MRQASLIILKRGNKILLAMKKRGFGKGRWNGVGGKPDKEKGESVLDSAYRETEEEIGVRIKNPKKLAIMDFFFPEVPKEKEFDQQVHLFIVDEWEGEPVETEEMRPQWFDIKNIPYDKMWEDDKFWLPLVLQNKKLKCRFCFDKNDEIIDKFIEEVDELD